MISLFLARGGFEHRICLAGLEDEQPADTQSSLAGSAVAQPFLELQDRLSMLLDMLNNGIKAIRSGEHDNYLRHTAHLSDVWQRLRVVIHVFASNVFSSRL